MKPEELMHKLSQLNIESSTAQALMAQYLEYRKFEVLVTYGWLSALFVGIVVGFYYIAKKLP